MAALTTIALLASAGYSAYEAYSASRAKGPTAPAMPVVPAAPDPNVAEQQAEAAMTKRKAKAALAGSPSGNSATLLTGPGPSAAASTQSKTLLGL